MPSDAPRPSSPPTWLNRTHLPSWAGGLVEEAGPVTFLGTRRARPWSVPDGGRAGLFTTVGYHLGNGPNPLEVAVATSSKRPNEADVRILRKRRRGNIPSRCCSSSPTRPAQASVCRRAARPARSRPSTRTATRASSNGSPSQPSASPTGTPRPASSRPQSVAIWNCPLTAHPCPLAASTLGGDGDPATDAPLGAEPGDLRARHLRWGWPSPLPSRHHSGTFAGPFSVTRSGTPWCRRSWQADRRICADPGGGRAAEPTPTVTLE